MKLQELTVRKLRLSLVRPYVLSYRTFTEFAPIFVEARDADGRVGWGEGHISPGASKETREGGWAFCREYAAAIVGKDTKEAKAIVAANLDSSKVAGTALLTAIEMLEGHPLLRIEQATRLPLLTPLNSHAPTEIAQEVEDRLGDGFRTFKIKVGKDAAGDAERIRLIQEAVAGRATIRIDANGGYSEPEALSFAAALEPTGIECFEQPCEGDDWDVNARVASVSPVPIMLDEPIFTLADIRRAAGIRNVGFCKLKLKRFGGLTSLKEALDSVREFGMEPVLGDGLATELGCWMEACVGRVTIRNAGEFNGFLKPKLRLFTERLQFSSGELVLPPGFWPTINRHELAAIEIARERYVCATSLGNRP